MPSSAPSAPTTSTEGAPTSSSAPSAPTTTTEGTHTSFIALKEPLLHDVTINRVRCFGVVWMSIFAPEVEGDAEGWHRRVPGIFARRSGRGLGVGSGGRGGAVVVWDVEGRVAADAGAPVAGRDVSFRSSSTATKLSTTSLSELGSNESPPLPTRPGLA